MKNISNHLYFKMGIPLSTKNHREFTLFVNEEWNREYTLQLEKNYSSKKFVVPDDFYEEDFDEDLIIKNVIFKKQHQKYYLSFYVDEGNSFTMLEDKEEFYHSNEENFYFYNEERGDHFFLMVPLGVLIHSLSQNVIPKIKLSEEYLNSVIEECINFCQESESEKSLPSENSEESLPEESDSSSHNSESSESKSESSSSSPKNIDRGRSPQRR